MKAMREFEITVVGNPDYNRLKITGEMSSSMDSPYYKIDADGYTYLFPKSITIITFKTK